MTTEVTTAAYENAAYENTQTSNTFIFKMPSFYFNCPNQSKIPFYVLCGVPFNHSSKILVL